MEVLPKMRIINLAHARESTINHELPQTIFFYE